jgi:hypothetical protein
MMEKAQCLMPLCTPMGMRQTFLWFVFYFWLLATLGTLVAFYIPWVSGTRVPGRRLGSVPLLKQLGRRNAEAASVPSKSNWPDGWGAPRSSRS